jgi:hypothetical protein
MRHSNSTSQMTNVIYILEPIQTLKVFFFFFSFVVLIVTQSLSWMLCSCEKIGVFSLGLEMLDKIK